MKPKKIFNDVTFWILVAANVYLILYYRRHPDSISDIILLFWIQSVLIGIFNFLDMLTLRNFAESSFKTNGEPVVTKLGRRKGCTAWFFAVHYGIFHLVYFVFLVSSLIDIKKIDWSFIQLSFFVILAACLSNFIQNKIRNKTEEVNIGAMFFLPYARIIPMHLVILAPVFFNISAPLLFLTLKTFADVVMYLIYQNIVFKPGRTVAQ